MRWGTVLVVIAGVVAAVCFPETVAAAASGTVADALATATRRVESALDAQARTGSELEEARTALQEAEHCLESVAAAGLARPGVLSRTERLLRALAEGAHGPELATEAVTLLNSSGELADHVSMDGEMGSTTWEAGSVAKQTQESCWDAEVGYSFGMCCDSIWGDAGLGNCWDQEFTYERCCFFHAGNGNEKFLPAMRMQELHIVPGPQLRWVWRGPALLRLRQNLSDAGWDEQIAGFLWQQAYAMLRWMEALPNDLFEGRTVLELGTGIGLLGLHAAGRGALVTATDGAARSLQAARGNAELNLPADVAWNHLTWRLVRWEKAQTKADVRLVGLSPPYDVIICSALLYAPVAAIRHLVRLLWLVTDSRSEILWGSGFVNPPEVRAQKWRLVMSCFEVVEDIDAVAAGYTRVAETRVVRLRRRRRGGERRVRVEDPAHGTGPDDDDEDADADALEPSLCGS